MNYISTRNANLRMDAPHAIVKGLAPDGGLMTPGAILRLPDSAIRSLSEMSYQQRAVYIMSRFLTGFSTMELTRFASAAYSAQKFANTDIAPVRKLDDATYCLELWHGPTCAFKDMALQMLPHLLSASLEKTLEKRTACILTATSGDTGKAALEGFRDVENTKIMVFYPKDGVSDIQELQMVTQEGENVQVCSVIGNFDDAQNGVKKLFSDEQLEELSRLTSSATYMLNGGIGIFFGLLIVGAVIFASDGVILAIVPVLEQLGVTDAIEVIAPAMIMVLALVSSMNMISASALSLEGGSFWIIKSMPLTSKQILIAKAIPNALVTAPPFLLFSVVVAVAIGAPAHYYPIYVLMPAVVAVMTSLLGIILNVAFPKFDYVNEAQVVKQSLPVFLALLVPVIIMMPAVAIVLAASVSGLGVVALWLVLAAFVGISVLLYLILSGPAARRLDAIER